MTPLQRWRLQLDRLCRVEMKPSPKPLTGIEKKQKESVLTANMWRELEGRGEA